MLQVEVFKLQHDLGPARHDCGHKLQRRDTGISAYPRQQFDGMVCEDSESAACMMFRQYKRFCLQICNEKVHTRHCST